MNLKKTMAGVLTSVLTLNAVTAVSTLSTDEEFSVFAAEKPVLAAGTADAAPGETADIVLELKGNPGIIAMGINVSYDTSCLELESAEDCGLFPDTAFTPSGDIKLVPFKLLWADETGTENKTQSGKLAVMRFKVLDTASEGLTEVNISVDKENTFNAALDEVSVGSVNGGINVIKEEEPTTTTTVTTTSVTTTSASTTTTVTTATEPSIEPSIIYGDANGDGKVNVRDAAFIANKLAQGKADELPGSSDFNQDGKINVRDAAAIAKFLAGGK